MAVLAAFTWIDRAGRALACGLKPCGLAVWLVLSLAVLAGCGERDRWRQVEDRYAWHEGRLEIDAIWEGQELTLVRTYRCGSRNVGGGGSGARFTTYYPENPRNTTEFYIEDKGFIIYMGGADVCLGTAQSRIERCIDGLSKAKHCRPWGDECFSKLDPRYQGQNCGPVISKAMKLGKNGKRIQINVGGGAWFSHVEARCPGDPRECLKLKAMRNIQTKRSGEPDPSPASAAPPPRAP